MMDWIITAGGRVLFGLAVFFWAHWTNLERNVFANGNGRHLE